MAVLSTPFRVSGIRNLHVSLVDTSRGISSTNGLKKVDIFGGKRADSNVVCPYIVEENLSQMEEIASFLPPNNSKKGTYKFVKSSIKKSNRLSVLQELFALSLPLASAGVSVSIFNIISKLFNIPLLGVATSFVAEDISKNAMNNGRRPTEVLEKKQLASVSTAILLSVGIGIFEALALYASSMKIPAERFIKLRAIGSPAAVVSLALQGSFVVLWIQKLLFGNVIAIFLFPLLTYTFRLGVIGSVIANVSSQYVIAILKIWFIGKRVVLFPLKIENLQFAGYAKSGGFLFGRTVASLGAVTLGASMAACQASIHMAAHQICYQVWLAVSLLADVIASSAQAMIASSYSEGDFSRVKEITFLILKVVFFLYVLPLWVRLSSCTITSLFEFVP
ncbi:hypothetical protein MKW92_021741 [Papaver armeniacum]|nr:hypothetical protein MKW92_021741 [Papaver armeniacum]